MKYLLEITGDRAEETRKLFESAEGVEIKKLDSKVLRALYLNDIATRVRNLKK